MLSKPLAAHITEPIKEALNSITTDPSGFVVNPTTWYWKNPAGEIKPSVVNSAKFVSSKFQAHLKQNGWEIEATLAGQTIDAFKILVPPVGLTCFTLPEDNFIPLLTVMKNAKFPGYGSVASFIFKNFVAGKALGLPPELEPFRSNFEEASMDFPIRVGVEFETGNIASSFRALQKLQFLSDQDLIDVGVFITSISKKDSAAKIWPVSNRNGSFEELEKRNYRDQRSYIALDIGFAPDSFDENAPYLGDNGTLYQIAVTSEVDVDNPKYVKGLSSRGKSYFTPQTLI